MDTSRFIELLASDLQVYKVKIFLQSQPVAASYSPCLDSPALQKLQIVTSLYWLALIKSITLIVAYITINFTFLLQSFLFPF